MMSLSVSFASELGLDTRVVTRIISHQQLKPEPDKIEAIRKFQEPASKEDLQRLLGMVNYL